MRVDVRKHFKKTPRLFDCRNSVLDKYKCTECENFESDFLVVLRQHFIKNHSIVKLEQPEYKCLKCGLRTYSNYLSVRHRLFGNCQAKVEVKKELYSCGECDFATYSSVQYNEHSTNEHLPRKKSYRCQQCTFTSLSSVSYANHLSSFHPSISTSSFYYCRKCWFKTTSHEKLASHEQARHSSKWKKSNRRTQAELQCKLCQYHPFAIETLERHIQMYHPNVDHVKCEICGYRTMSAAHMELHICKTHVSCENESKITYVCEACACRSCDRRTLIKHVMQHHVTQQNKYWFRCEMCHLEFNTKQSLKDHAFKEHFL